jgi:integrative and conjugative element protein (TIGR02256 family)
LTAEDRKRHFRLDWLEMLHYRAVLNESNLRHSLRARNGRLRYGNSCRDVSTQLSQDDTAIAAAIAGKAIKRLIKDDEASVSIYQGAPNGEIKLFTPKISSLRSVKLYDWTIRFDDELHKQLITRRKARLPNETGGILLGHFDTHNRICSIIDMIPSPPDSVEWPTSYIRGSNGLLQKVEAVEAQTLGQIGYVGEWHSHPDRASVMPSEEDLKAYSWLIAHMNLETLPAIMLIVGDRRQFSLVTKEA